MTEAVAASHADAEPKVLVWPKAAALGTPAVLIIHAGSCRVPPGTAALS